MRSAADRSAKPTVLRVAKNSGSIRVMTWRLVRQPR